LWPVWWLETGGDLSHGSIILREIGLPAITNVRGATRHIVTGEKLVVQAGVGVVERADLAATEVA
jgi:pyruvate,water dikinase